MPSKVCAHRDLHTVDNLQTCLECGETLFLAQPTTLRDFANKSKQSTVFDHDYDALRLQTGNEIRLVVLLPGKFNDPVVITITIADLLQNPQYEAVSYTWSNSDGDDSKTGRVHSPNGILSITENCEAALRQLRLPAAIRLVWIDAICIDQSCVEERNHQVNLMGKIYRCASKVIICIREANKDLSVCMKRLREKRFPSEGAGAQLQSLFRNRYFHRVWVIQEVVLARNVLLQVNDQDVMLDSKTRQYLETNYSNREYPYPGFLRLQVSGYLTMYDGLRLSLRATASDRRDLVYGILSILSPFARDFIRVDYSQTYEQVLSDAIMALVIETHDLNIVLFATLRGDGDFAQMASFELAELRDSVEYQAPSKFDLRTDFSLQKKRTDGQWRRRVYVVLQDTAHSQGERIYGKEVSRDQAAVSVIHKTLPSRQLLARLRVHAQLLDFSHGSTGYHNGLYNHCLSACGSRIENMEKLLDVNRTFEKTYTSERPQASTHWDTKCIAFFTCKRIGFSYTVHEQGTQIYVVDGITCPLLLREVGEGAYRILGHCSFLLDGHFQDKCFYQEHHLPPEIEEERRQRHLIEIY